MRLPVRVQRRRARGAGAHHSALNTSLMYPRRSGSDDLVSSSSITSGPHAQSVSGRSSGLRSVSAMHTMGSLHRAKSFSWQPGGVTSILCHADAGQSSSLASARLNSGAAKKPRSCRNSPTRLRKPLETCGPERMSNRSDPFFVSSG